MYIIYWARLSLYTLTACQVSLRIFLLTLVEALRDIYFDSNKSAILRLRCMHTGIESLRKHSIIAKTNRLGINTQIYVKNAYK